MNKIPTVSALGAVLVLLGSGVATAAPTLEQRVAELEALAKGMFAARAHVESVNLPQNSWLKLASLSLPKGSYVLSGQVVGWAVDGKPTNIGLGCWLMAGNTDGKPIGNQLGGGFANLLANQFEINPIGVVELQEAGIVWIQCRTDKADTVHIQWNDLIATRVPTLFENGYKTVPNPPSPPILR